MQIFGYVCMDANQQIPIMCTDASSITAGNEAAWIGMAIIFLILGTLLAVTSTALGIVLARNTRDAMSKPRTKPTSQQGT